jgi:hypothetical protein
MFSENDMETGKILYNHASRRQESEAISLKCSHVYNVRLH